jgi:spermidine synthase
MRKYGGEMIYRTRGPHGPLEVVEDQHTRSMHFGDAVCQSQILTFQPGVLLLRYTRYMMSALLFAPGLERVLLIGLGGGSMVHFLLTHYPESLIDVAEPRSDVIQAAQRFFQLPDVPGLRIHHTDGVRLVQNPPAPPYDLLLVDAYTRSGMAAEVSNAAFFGAARECLAEDGVLAVNASRVERDAYRRTLRDLRRTFPRAALRLPVIEKGNEVLLGLNPGSLDISRPLLQRRATDLQRRHGLEYEQFVKVLCRDNADLLPAPGGTHRTAQHRPE